MALKTLFDASVSPETGKGDGTSSVYTVWESANDKTVGPVSIWGYGTWSSVNLLIETCADLAQSPQVWSTEATKTANFVHHFSPSEGTGFRCTINSSGSPLPSLTVKARGPLQ